MPRSPSSRGSRLGRFRANSTAGEASSSQSSNSTSRQGNPNLSPELLIWRRLQRGELPHSLEQSATQDTKSRKDERQQSPRAPGRTYGPSSRANTPQGTRLRRSSASWVPESEKLPWRERIRHFTWTWFTMTMATGGVANVLWTVPMRFTGLYAIGVIFFIFNLVLFTFNVAMISLRFYLHPKTFRASFVHPTESLFIPAAVISFGTILINISQYGVGPKTGAWLDVTMTALFWFDCFLAIAFSSGIYLTLWSTQSFTIAQMTPVWIFPAYPLLIVGPHAGVLSTKVGADSALGIIVGGFIVQGIGFMVSLMIYSAYLYRLMTQKLPRESLRPGMFISVGPSGFTISGLISMGQQLPNVVGTTFMGEEGVFAAKVTAVMANWTGIWLWGLAMWFFFVSVGAHSSVAARGKLDFSMTWYSFVFPNTALVTATFAVSKALDDNYPIAVLGCVMTGLLVAMWAFVFGMMLRAVKVKQILWPQKQEDREEGGWKEVWVPRRELSLRKRKQKRKQMANSGVAAADATDVEAGADATDAGAADGVAVVDAGVDVDVEKAGADADPDPDPMMDSEITALDESQHQHQHQHQHQQQVFEMPPFTRPGSPEM